MGRRIRPGVASPLLLLFIFASALGLVFARSLGNVALQLAATLASMVVVFFASHPLGHFFIGRAYGVGTDYFFVDRSDFRRVRVKPISLVGGLMPTIGTKLKKDDLAKLPPRTKGYIFGAGVIVSNTFVGIELLYVLTAGFGLPAVLLGTLFFVVMLATELVFSTKVGDLGKMSKEFKKQVQDRGALSQAP